MKNNMQNEKCQNTKDLISKICNGDISLSLLYFYLMQEDVKELSKALEVNKSLNCLDLYCNNLGFQGAQELAASLKVNKGLETLYISENNIGDKGVVALADMLEVNKSLKSLNLFLNSIGDEGAIKLAAALKKNTTLVRLNLCSNNIGDEGALGLADMLAFNNCVHSVDLSHNNLRYLGFNALNVSILGNPNVFYASYNGRSNDVREELAKRQKYIAKLIKKWRLQEHCDFTNYEITEFYHNLSAIRLVSSVEAYLKMDFHAFERDVNCKMLNSFWHVREAIKHLCNLGDIITLVSNIYIALPIKATMRAIVCSMRHIETHMDIDNIQCLGQ